MAMGLLPMALVMLPQGARFWQVFVKQMAQSPSSAISRAYRPARSQWLLLRRATQDMPCAFASSAARVAACWAISGPMPFFASHTSSEPKPETFSISCTDASHIPLSIVRM